MSHNGVACERYDVVLGICGNPSRSDCRRVLKPRGSSAGRASTTVAGRAAYSWLTNVMDSAATTNATSITAAV